MSYLDKWVEAIRELKSDFDEVKTFNSVLPTLDYFPDAFTPLTVITGTGLATPPSRISDLFRANASLTDLFFLNELKLPKKTRIVSDRFVIDMDPEDRVKHFGKSHLLLIGGPKVNAVTRKFGKYGFFRFQVRDEEKHFQDFYDSLKNEDDRSDLFPDPDCVKMFYELLANPKRSDDNSDDNDEKFKDMVDDPSLREKINKKSIEILEKLGEPKNFTYEDIVKVFNPTSLVDPIRGLCLSPDAGDKKDFTMITIAPNFYNRDSNEEASFKSYKYKFVSVIVAGIDKLGTVSGVKKLAQPEKFDLHPVGGFLQAAEGNSTLDFEIYNDSRCSWSEKLTPSYTIEDFIGKIKDFNKNPNNVALQKISDEEWLDDKGLTNYLKFLEFFQTKK